MVKRKKKKAAPVKKAKKKSAEKEEAVERRGRPPKHATPTARREHRRKYSKKYYNENKGEISQKRSKKWRAENNVKMRAREKRRAEEKRALERAKKHQQHLDDSKAASKEYWKGRQTLTPRKVMVGGKRTTVYSTGVLGRMICRTMPTLRRWIANRVLPGCTMRDEAGRYWFSLAFCQAVQGAVESVYLYDGRCSGKVTRQLILEALQDTKLLWSKFDDAGRKTSGPKEGRQKVRNKGTRKKGR